MHWEELLVAIRNTLVIGLGTILLAVPLGTMLALLILRTNVWGARWAWLLISSQLIVPLYVFAGGWSAGFGTLGWWPLAPANLQALDIYSLFAVGFIHTAAAIPWVCLILSLGLVWSPRNLEDLALIESGWYTALKRVTLPSLTPWLALAAVWACTPVLTEMVVTNLYQVRTLPEQVYLDISLNGTSSWTYAAGLVGCALPLTVCLLLIRRRLSVWPAALPNSPHRFDVQSTHHIIGAKIPVTLVVWSTVLALVALPMINLIYKAGWEVVPDEFHGATHLWTLRRLWMTLYETLTGFTIEAYWTAALAIGAATVSMLGALLLVGAGRLHGLSWGIHGLCIIMISVPGPLAGQWVAWLFNATSSTVLSWLYERTLLAPMLAQQFRLLPIAYILSCTILSGIDRRTWELAKIDSLAPMSILRNIIVPQTGGAWIAAWVLLAAFSAGELSTNLLLLPPGVTTIAQRLFELLHFGMRYQDSGLCLILLSVGWLVALIAWKTRNGFH